MAKTYGFGVVGTGFIGGVHGDAIQSMPNARLVACCDTREAAATPTSARCCGGTIST